MKLRTISFLFASVLACLPAVGESVTLYTHRHYPSDDELYRKFTEQTGIEVKVVKGNADEFIERIRAEGENSPADLFLTADAGRLERAKQVGILQPIESATLQERIPAHLRDPQNHWFGFTRRARIFAYAKDRVNPADLSTYEALAQPQWKGRLLTRSSSNVYTQSLQAAMIAALGERDATAWARNIRGNMARAPQGSDRDQIRAVAAGLGDVAIVNTYYVGLMLNSPEEKDRRAAESVGIFFPNQDDRGTHVNISGGGVVKTSKNPEAAQKFLEFLVSDEIQQVFPVTSYEYPVVESVEWGDVQKSWGTFKEDQLNAATLGELNSQAVRSLNRAGWE